MHMPWSLTRVEADELPVEAKVQDHGAMLKRNNQVLAPPFEAADSLIPQGLLRARGGPLPTLSPTPIHDNRLNHAAAKNRSALDERPQRSHNSLELRELSHSV
jgi:hypothetical protein